MRKYALKKILFKSFFAGLITFGLYTIFAIIYILVIKDRLIRSDSAVEDYIFIIIFMICLSIPIKLIFKKS